MNLITHMLAGALVGKFTGNYPVAIAAALVLDLDHIPVYIKNKVMFNNKIFKVLTQKEDPFGNQRNILHSIFFFIPLSVAIYLTYVTAWLSFSLGYLSHMLLDLLDDADYRVFYPLQFKINGFVRYLSKTEFIFTVGIIVLLLI